MQLAELESRWQRLFTPFQSDQNSVKKIFFDLVTVYSSERRYYHNLLHIQHVLNIVSMLETLPNNFATVQMAAWFHDIIYDPKSKENEENSAEYAFAALSKLGIPLEMINHVASIILNTKNHHASLDDIDSQILLDADLSILGSEQLKYNAYAEAIRQEYSWLSDKEYQIGRKNILQTFLRKDRIYLTDKAFQILELKARENMKAELLNF
jgi:predicted metal-dependent HD superfamily phosphohydrolase